MDTDLKVNGIDKKILKTLGDGEGNTFQISKSSGVPYSTVRDHLYKLVAMGLVSVRKEEKRGGIVVRYLWKKTEVTK